MWYSEKINTTGRWSPMMTAEALSEKGVEGAKSRLRNVRKIPFEYRNMTLDQLFVLFNSDFEPTHMHVKTGGLYRVTGRGRLEVTGDEAYPLVEYENAAGEKYAQRRDRFDDGRFTPINQPVDERNPQ